MGKGDAVPGRHFGDGRASAARYGHPLARGGCARARRLAALSESEWTAEAEQRCGESAARANVAESVGASSCGGGSPVDIEELCSEAAADERYELGVLAQAR